MLSMGKRGKTVLSERRFPGLSPTTYAEAYDKPGCYEHANIDSNGLDNNTSENYGTTSQDCPLAANAIGQHWHKR